MRVASLVVLVVAASSVTAAPVSIKKEHRPYALAQAVSYGREILSHELRYLQPLTSTCQSLHRATPSMRFRAT